MRSKKGSWPKCAEERPLRPLKEERPLRSSKEDLPPRTFNSQVAREEFRDVWSAETDSDDELSSWDEDVEYRSCKYMYISLDHQNSSTYHQSSWRTVRWILDARGRVNWEGRSHYNMAFKANWPIKSFQLWAGRWINMPYNDRSCVLCNTSKIADEFHYILECSALTIIRKEYLHCRYYIRPNVIKF